MLELQGIKSKVHMFEGFLPKLKEHLLVLCAKFEAGQVSQHFPNWTNITSDREILLDISAGISIECSETPTQHWLPKQTFTKSEYPIIEGEIKKLLSKQVISQVEYNPNQFISGIFLRPKTDGTHRLILNLKKFNEVVTHHHFKMDSLNTIIKLMTKNCYMASLDMKDAYYTIPIRENDKKYLRFRWDEKIFQFNALPNGLSCCPRKFTKILKPALANLHKSGHISVAYLDDMYLQGQSYEQCVANVIDTITLLTKLGFVMHPLKSAFNPSQEIVILGFILNSISMTIRLTQNKKDTLCRDCKVLSHKKSPTIREVARVLGKIISSFPGVKHGPLHFRRLEREKTLALTKCKGNFDSKMCLSGMAIQELTWWVHNTDSAYNNIAEEHPVVIITTDASLNGWGATCDGVSTGGIWSELESKQHINYLEMLAVHLGLQTFASGMENIHIRVMCDNTAAVNIINHMGTSHSDSCNKMAKTIWDWCIQRNLWISLAHIPGKENVIADFESRRKQRESEWMLDKTALSHALNKLDFQPQIDLFASRLNNQFTQYVSYRPDPLALAIDAFTMQWSDLYFYAFPPFSLIPHVLSKIQREKATGICVFPDWPTQGWYAQAMAMAVKPPVYLKARPDLLQLPSCRAEKHPLHQKLNLLVYLLSGKR